MKECTCPQDNEGTPILSGDGQHWVTCDLREQQPATVRKFTHLDEFDALKAEVRELREELGTLRKHVDLLADHTANDMTRLMIYRDRKASTSGRPETPNT